MSNRSNRSNLVEIYIGSKLYVSYRSSGSSNFQHSLECLGEGVGPPPPTITLSRRECGEVRSYPSLLGAGPGRRLPAGRRPSPWPGRSGAVWDTEESSAAGASVDFRGRVGVSPLTGYPRALAELLAGFWTLACVRAGAGWLPRAVRKSSNLAGAREGQGYPTRSGDFARMPHTRTRARCASRAPAPLPTCSPALARRGMVSP